MISVWLSCEGEVRVLRLLILIYCFSFPLLAAPEVQEPRAINQVKSISLSKEDGFQSLLIRFSKAYDQQITYLYDPGMFSAILPASGFAPKLGTTRINNQFIQQIRLRHAGDRSILEIRFADDQFNSVGKVTHRLKSDSLTFLVYKKTPDPSVITGEFTEQPKVAPKKAQDVVLKPADFPLGELSPNIGSFEIIQMLIVLALILLLIYSLLWAYNRFFLKNLNFKKGAYSIRLASTFHLGPKQKVVVLEINDMAFACSVSSQQMNVIAQVDAGSFQQFMKEKSGGSESIDFARLREDYKQSQKVADPPQEGAPKKNFAAELVERVKQLKPID